jgi:hypothetical protein
VGPPEDGWEEHGVLKGTDHTPIEIDGLWGIGQCRQFRPDTNTLFFAAGLGRGDARPVGSITVP